MKQITCPHCGDTYPDFDVAHVCSKGPYAPRLKSKMNEQIRELAEQADEYAEQTVHYYQGQFDGLTWEGKIKQTRDTKFAELIVRECLDQLHVSDWDEDYDKGIYWSREQIKNHFGVEE